MRKVIHLNKYRYEKIVRMYAEYYHKPIDYGKNESRLRDGFRKSKSQ